MKKVQEYLPLGLKVLGWLAGGMALYNGSLLGQSAEGIHAGNAISYVVPWIAASGGTFFGATMAAPNRDLRTLVDGLLAKGDFPKAKQMIEQWATGEPKS